MDRTASRGYITNAAIALVTTIALTLGIVAVFTPPATASTCERIYGEAPSDDMPTDPGTAPMPDQDCPTDTPTPPTPTTPPPTVQPPTPEPPKVQNKDPKEPKQDPKPKAPKPDPKPKTTSKPKTPKQPPATDPTPRATPDPAPPAKQVTQHKKPTPDKEPKRKVRSKKVCPQAAPAAPAAQPVVTTDFEFPWLLALLAGLLTMIIGGIVTVRVFMATGHKWHPAVRRAIAGPDHTRIDA